MAMSQNYAMITKQFIIHIQYVGQHDTVYMIHRRYSAYEIPR